MSVKKAILKPVEVEYVVFEGVDSKKDVKGFCGGMYVSDFIDRRSDIFQAEINTKDGVKILSKGDIIIKSESKFEVVSKEDFEKLYEPVD